MAMAKISLHCILNTKFVFIFLPDIPSEITEATTAFVKPCKKAKKGQRNCVDFFSISDTENSICKILKTANKILEGSSFISPTEI